MVVQSNHEIEIPELRDNGRTPGYLFGVYETESGSSRIVPMEGLRGWAVLLVFFVHFHTAFKAWLSPASPLFQVSQFLGTVGGSGVDLFFVISGYLIYGAVIRPGFTSIRFLRRRVQRIYPAFLCVSLIYVGLWIFSSDDNFKFHGTIGQQASYLIQNILLMPGIFRVKAMNGVAWSLSYEMFFYLLLPLVVAVAGARRWSRLIRVYFFLFLAAAGLLISPLFDHPRVRLVGFLFGIVLFETVDRFRQRSTNITDFSALAIYLSGLGLVYWIEKAAIVPDRLWAPLSVAAASLTSFVFCGLCFHGGGVLGRIMSWNPLRYLGNMSYSFYLIHPLAIGVVKQIFQRISGPGLHQEMFLVMLPVAFAASWVAATLLFVAVEKPLSIKMTRKAVRPASPVPVPTVGFQHGG
jgi:exopolysaccharide production protein ExoZ